MFWFLLIIELKNARWNIEIRKSVGVACVFVW